MRHISAEKIQKAAKKLIYDANFVLPVDVSQKIAEMHSAETSRSAKTALEAIEENIKKTKKEVLPLCQDTGTAVFFVEIGYNISLDEPIAETLEKATQIAYKEYFLRASIADDPLFNRKNTQTNCPAIVHMEQTKKDTLRITFLPKGGGAENKSVLKMLRPSDGQEGVTQAVLDAAKKAGGTSCPPWILGIGIGGNFDSVAFLAKKAIIRPLDSVHSNPKYTKLEEEIAKKVEALKIGTMGLGGEKTILGVHICTAPTHIASLPVAVNFQCHSARSAEVTL